MAQIYKYSHVVNNPDCIKNHPGWEEELREALEDMQETAHDN